MQNSRLEYSSFRSLLYNYRRYFLAASESIPVLYNKTGDKACASSLWQFSLWRLQIHRIHCLDVALAYTGLEMSAARSFHAKVEHVGVRSINGRWIDFRGGGFIGSGEELNAQRDSDLGFMIGPTLGHLGSCLDRSENNIGSCGQRRHLNA